MLGVHRSHLSEHTTHCLAVVQGGRDHRLVLPQLQIHLTERAGLVLVLKDVSAVSRNGKEQRGRG